MTDNRAGLLTQLDIRLPKLDIRLGKTLTRSGRGDSGFDFLLDVEFSTNAGVTVVFGASGAGKTTLLECIAGLVTPESGRVSIHSGTEEVCLFDSTRNVNLPVQVRRLGYVFQTLALFPHLTVEENVGYGLGYGLNPLSKREIKDRVREILNSFHIGHLAGQRPNQISGGERQRVALARSLVPRPRALLLDEPLSALDYKIKWKIISDLLAWNEQHQIPVLYVTHAIEETFAVSDQVIVLQDGRIEKQGRPGEVLTSEREQLIRQLSSTRSGVAELGAPD